jgi:hypothetical protein
MWELIPKILAPVVPIVAGLYRFRSSLQLRPRSTLKADCEMLTTLRQAGVAKSCSIVESHIDEQVARLYGAGKSNESRLHQIWKQATPHRRVALGGLVLAVGVVSTGYLVRNGFSWWSLLTGYVALAGLGVLGGSLSPQHRLRDKYTLLGERSFELFEDKAHAEITPEVAALVQDIKTLHERVAEGELVADSGHRPAPDPG